MIPSTFQIKSFASIAASIINHARAVQSAITDFTPGSVARTLLESPAVEIEQLYIQFFNALLEAIPTSTYLAFGFGALPAQNASGLVQLTITAQSTDTVIPAGTTWQVSGAASGGYQNPADVTITAGNTVGQIRVVSQAAGATWNVPAGTPFVMVPQIAGFVSAQAYAAFEGGADAETPDEQKARFASFIASLSRGTEDSLNYVLPTVALYDPSGLQTERVQGWFIDQVFERNPTLPRAQVDIYIFNGVDGASSALITQTLNVLTGYFDANGNPVPGYKAAGVHFNVYAAALQTVAVTGALVLQPGFVLDDVEAAVALAIQTYITGIQINKTVFPDGIADAAKAVPGVASIALTAPAAPFTPSLGAKAMPGTVTLTLSTGTYNV